MMNFLDAARLFKDIWELYKSYYSEKLGDKLWEQILEEGHGLHKKYQQSAFSKEMIVAVISELERISKKKTSQEDI